MCVQLLNRVRLCATLQTVVRQSSLTKWFSRQEYWSGLPCPSPGDRPRPGLNPCLLCLLYWLEGSLSLSHLGNPGWKRVFAWANTSEHIHLMLWMRHGNLDHVVQNYLNWNWKKEFPKSKKKKKKKERKKAMNLTIYPVGDIMTEKNYSKCL